MTITPGYFEALGVPLLRGRLFSSVDSASAPAVAIIGMTMARRYSAGSRSRRSTVSADRAWSQTRHGSRLPESLATCETTTRGDRLPNRYLPLTQHPVRALTSSFRPQEIRSIAATTIQAAVTGSVDLGLPIYDIRTMGQLLNDDLSGAYFTAGFLAVLGLVHVVSGNRHIRRFVLRHIRTPPRDRDSDGFGRHAEPDCANFCMEGAPLASIGIAIGGVLAELLFRFIRSD